MVESSGVYRLIRPLRFPKRSIPLKLLAILLLVFCILSWVRFTQGIKYTPLLRYYAQPILPIYLLISGAVWGIVSLACVIFLWMKYTFSLWLIAMDSAFFTIWYWLDRAMLGTSPDRWRGVFLPILLFVIFLAFIYSTVFYILPEKMILSERRGEDETAK